MGVLDTVNLINKATGFPPAQAPAVAAPAAPTPSVVPQINQAAGFPSNGVAAVMGQPNVAPTPPHMAPLQLFHQTFMGPDMPPSTNQNAMEQGSAIMAKNQQIMAQNEAAIKSGQYHQLQPLMQLPTAPLQKLPIYTKK